jgi:hypothetical protein
MFKLCTLSYNRMISVLFSVKVIWITAEIPSDNATGHYEGNKVDKQVRAIQCVRKEEVQCVYVLVHGTSQG